jgi:hypothetical protein
MISLQKRSNICQNAKSKLSLNNLDVVLIGKHLVFKNTCCL